MPLPHDAMRMILNLTGYAYVCPECGWSGNEFAVIKFDGPRDSEGMLCDCPACMAGNTRSRWFVMGTIEFIRGTNTPP